ncbi:nucleotide exchange factor GrpE [uncultured Ruminococcus sp.]|uniref:nucleotide exchange factor GrpE n=1 Tax=uncultured Ruminococcus sp. TaxID=165186 RepID=UPI00261E360C|nr:nucleotide exchange factor GrpE [uncultured Ruminococcus sp.]
MEKNEKFSEELEELEELAGDTPDAPEGEDTDELEEADAVSEYNDTATQFSELEDALAEANDKYLRLFAEYDNYRKRTAKEKTETYQNASVQCVEKLLPVLDSFERSLEAECSDENFKNGMGMIYNQLKGFLTQMNVTEIEALGAEFDPNIHNAIQQQDGTDYAANHVCAVFQKGYMLGDKLVRPAMVAVAV